MINKMNNEIHGICLKFADREIKNRKKCICFMIDPMSISDFYDEGTEREKGVPIGN